MRTTEKLALLTALQKMVKSALDDTRAEANEELLEAFEEDGVTKKALRLGGVKVGDFIVVMSTGKWRITDSAAFLDFALTYGFAREIRSIKSEYLNEVLNHLEREFPEALEVTVEPDPKWENYVENVAGTPTYLDSGEVVPGIEFVGQTVKNTQVRGCKPEEVGPIIAKMGGIDALLLESKIKQLSSPEEA